MMKTLRDNGQLSNAQKDGDGNTLDEINFAKKVKNEEIEQRLAKLFEREKEDDIEQSLNEPYLSVKEGLTTDTQISSDGEDNKQNDKTLELFKETNQEIKKEIEAGI